MPLIDHTFFTGLINIPNTDKPEVLEELQAFIYEFEQDLLRKVLGLPLYNAFGAGLTESPVADRWTELLYGKEYTLNANLYRWKGLINYGINNANLNISSFTYFVVGRGQANDPAPGTATYTNPALNGNYLVIQRGFGPLRNDEVVYNEHGFTLVGTTFTSEDTYFLLPVSAFGISATPTNALFKEGLIACYVYYWYMRNKATSTTGVGETISKTDNATRVSPAFKMSTAWNKMVGWISDLFVFLNDNKATYPEWELGRVYSFEWQTMNPYF